LIADREGNIIVRLPHPETLVGKNMRKSHESIMDGNEAGWEEATGVDGVARIFGYVPAALPPKDFFLSAGQSKAEAFAAIGADSRHSRGHDRSAQVGKAFGRRPNTGSTTRAGPAIMVLSLRTD
jgi:hypothetical protein